MCLYSFSLLGSILGCARPKEDEILLAEGLGVELSAESALFKQCLSSTSSRQCALRTLQNQMILSDLRSIHILSKTCDISLSCPTLCPTYLVLSLFPICSHNSLSRPKVSASPLGRSERTLTDTCCEFSSLHHLY